MKLPEWLKLLKGSLDDQGDEPVTMLVSALIGYDPETGQGIDASDFANVLNGIPKRKEVKLFINSLGGSIPQGIAMCSMVTARGNVDTYCIGYAASMGNALFQSGRKRYMYPGTCLMIHNPAIGADGDENELESKLTLLRTIKADMVEMLNKRTKAGKKKISEMMSATTFMNPAMALELGFADEIVEGESAKNSVDASLIAKTCQKFAGAKLDATPVEETKQTKEKKPMKLLIAALAKAKLVASAELTDEAVIVANFEREFGTLSNLQAENTRLTNENTAFKSERKTRVEALVAKAITDKLVKEERKAKLIEMGVNCEADLAAYIEDLTAARGTQVVEKKTPKNSAPPLPKEKKEGGEEGEADETEQKIIDLQAEMKTQSPAQQVVTARKIRELRGRGDMFTAPREQKAAAK